MAEDAYTIKEFLAHSLNDMKETVHEIHADIKEIKADGKETKAKVEFQNGRVRKLEDWTTETSKILEHHTASIGHLKLDYTKDKGRLWGAIAVVTFLGGAIITLSVMAIDTKIEKGIVRALEANVKEIIK